MSRQRHNIKHDIFMQYKSMYDAGRGQSRHEDKKTGDDMNRIYSARTYSTYRQQGRQFADYALAHGCRTLDQARKVVPAYLQGMIDRGMSSYSVRTAASAIGKIYGVDYGSFGVTMPERHRDEITNNRGVSAAVKRRHVSTAMLERYGAILRCCGLRRKEALTARGRDLIFRDGRYYIDIPNGKGGKHRQAVVCGSEAEIQAVVDLFEKAGSDKIWQAGIPKDVPVHRFRAEYAARVYKAAARPVEALRGHDRYVCRNDMAGVVYDRAALCYVSKQLGHNRESVVAVNYLHGGI